MTQKTFYTELLAVFFNERNEQKNSFIIEKKFLILCIINSLLFGIK